MVRKSPLVELSEKIAQRKAKIGVIGLGYVGLPLAVEFAKAGFDVTGIDLDQRRIKGVNLGKSYIIDITTQELKAVSKTKRLKATDSFKVLAQQDAIIICVPTPLRKTREPDMSYIISATNEIKKYVRPGQVIVLESTTYPGTTDEIIREALESTGVKAGVDIALAFSPERIDPGNEVYTTKTIPKVIGGTSKKCTQLASELYDTIITATVPVSSTSTAEMVKLLENTFRAVNIGLVNEVALICERLGINVWEVIDAAKTKPFGFMAFYPGPGIGGHCIPSDPHYLAWKMRVHGYQTRFIELATQINGAMPEYVVSKVSKALNSKKKSLNGSHVLLMGLAYKPDVGDLRDSPAFDVAKLLQKEGVKLSYHDPHVPSVKLNGHVTKSSSLTKSLLKRIDCAVVLTNHSSVDYDLLLKEAPLIVDTRNQYKNKKSRKIQSL